MNWYCIHTKPQREAQALEHLSENLGLEAYFPRLRRQKVIRRVRKVVTEPLFPRYLFCRFDMASEYRAVRYAHDVINVVSFGAQPAIVSADLITSLRSWAGEADILDVGPQFSIGDRVEITKGPMQGLIAVVTEGRSDGERVAVLLSLLGYEARLTIDRYQLAKAM